MVANPLQQAVLRKLGCYRNLFLAAVSGIFLSLPIFATETAPSLAPVSVALEAYESGLARLVQSAVPAERAAAVKGLSIIASPTYFSARDALISDSSPLVQEALLSAVGTMGDDSPQAVRFVERCLGSMQEDVAQYAVRTAFCILETPVHFGHFWNPSKSTPLWSRGADAWGVKYEFITGVGEAKPWNDIAWRRLSLDTQTRLLSRAGTRESFALAISRISDRLKVKDEMAWSLLIPCEAVDKAFLRELLKDPRPQVQSYASRSLIAARDPEHIELIKKTVDDWLYHSGIVMVPDSFYNDWAVWSTLEFLSTGTLRELAQVGPKTEFFNLARELERRGKPFSYAELMGRDGPSHALNLGMIQPSWLHYWQLKSLVREKLYSELSDQITFSLMTPPPDSGIRELTAALADSPSFLSDMPPALADKCFEQVTALMEKACASESNEYRRQECRMPFWPLLGLLARGANEESLWTAWRTAKNPLKGPSCLVPVAWTVSQRGLAVRRMFARVCSQRWFQNGPSKYVGPALKNVAPDHPQETACPGSSAEGFSWIGVFPGLPGAIAGLKKDLFNTVRNDGTPYTREQVASELLVKRKAAFSCDDSAGLLQALADNRVAVRKAALSVCVGSLPPNVNYTGGLGGLGDLHRWIQANTPAILESSPTAVLPGPGLLDKDKAWLEGLFSSEQEACFKGLVEGILKPQGGITGCYIGPPPTHMYATLPSRAFLDAGMEYESETRALLDNRDFLVRHAAAWVLLNMFQEPAALEIFLKDARSDDPATKASSLFVLQTIRNKQSAPLFPPLLHEAPPALRQVGLLGVQAFRLKESLPDVENLVTDRDGAVAQVAVDTLGVLHPPEAWPLLLALVAKEGPLFCKASQALASYRTEEDVSIMVERLSRSDVSDREKEALIGVLSKITGHPSLQSWNEYVGDPKRQGLDPATISDWTTWWSAHKGQAAGDRLQDVLATLVEGVLREADEGKQNRFKYQLRCYFPGLTYLDGPWPLNAKGHDLLSEWWQVNKSKDAWDLMTCEQADPLSNLDLLMEVDQAKARRLVYSTFVRQARGKALAFQYHAGSESYHQLLVRMSGVDFGDPLLAKCGVRDQVLANWDAWARQSGWTP